MKVKRRESVLSVVENDMRFVQYINKLRKLGQIKFIQERYPYFSNDAQINGVMAIRSDNIRILKSGGTSRTLEDLLKSNCKFSEFSGSELIMLMEYIMDSNLLPQEFLNLPENASVGTELEFEGIREEDMDSWIKNKFPTWQVHTELSVVCGGEIISPPIMLNREKARIAIADYLIEIIKKENNIDLSNNPMAIMRLLNASENALCDLENNNLSEINVPNITRTEHGPISIKKILSREKIQNLLCKWDEMKSICNKLKEMSVKIDSKKAAVHVHFGAHYLGDNIENWRKFVKLYILYEDVLFRFFYGDKINARTSLYVYSPPVRDILYNMLPYINSAKSVSELEGILTEGKYSALNFEHVNYDDVNQYNFGNTVEFRIGNFTCEEEIIKNYIVCVLNIIRTAIDKTIDEEMLDRKIEQMYQESYPGNYMYNEVNLTKALEFVDLVYKNPIDKINFLIQYVKHFEHVYNDVRKPVIAKCFVKK